MSRPLYPEVGVIGLVPDRWTPQWQPRHFVLSRLTEYFQVVWMDFPHRLRGSVRSRRSYPTGCPKTPAAMQIYRPEFWLPMIGRPRWLADFTSRQRLRQASNLLRARGCSKLVLYVWRPEFADALQQGNWDLSVYHIDDEYSFSPTETAISGAERNLLESAGQVFIHSPALLEKKGKFNLNTEFVPNGVDYHAYATPVAEPADLQDIPYPRIGYVGHLKQMLDWPLLLELSARQPRWSFVFVGPAKRHHELAAALKQMSRNPNVYFLGGKDTEQLGAYPQYFDVCIMPYKMDDYTKYIYPLKMHEYLASGRPVVSSPIPSVESFRHVLGTATNLEQWCQAIGHALGEKENALARRQQRQAVAREHDWDKLVFRIARIMAERLQINFATADSIQGSHHISLSAPLL